MFLHVGEDIVISKKDIIGIFDKESCLNSHSSREYLEIAEGERLIKLIGSKDKVKSFIITSKYIYLSPISSVTLQKRYQKIFDLSLDD